MRKVAIMRRVRIWLICFVVFIILMLPSSSALAWKPKTHLFTAAVAIKEILGGPDSNYVTIDGKRYEVNPAIAQAIRSYPEHYFGGVVGPDGFPDIIFGQTIIHPDNRCDANALADLDVEESEEACGQEEVDGKTFTDEWLQFIYDEARIYYNRCNKALRPGEDKEVWVLSEHCPDAPGAVLAFMYGYLTHAAGDVWGHTFVNEFARGVFPSILDDEADRGIALRHLIVEGYVGEHTFGSRSGLEGLNNIHGLDAPTGYKNSDENIDYGGFIYSTFIINNEARRLARGSHFDNLLSLRKKLVELRPHVEPTSEICFLPDPFTGQSNCELARVYIDGRINVIDDGLKEWPRMSLRVANELFFKDDPGAALDHAGDFAEDFLLRMIGVPGKVLAILNKLDEYSDFLAALAELNPIKILKRELIEKATGIDVVAWEDYIKNPASYVNCDEFPPGLEPRLQIKLDPTTSLNLDGEIGITSTHSYPCNPPKPPSMDSIEKFNHSEFAAAENTIVLSRLLLLEHSELNKFLSDHHVGEIYGRPEYPEYLDNAMLGFIRTIDGNHQWRDRAPLSAAEGPKRYSLNGGMALWRDCLARERVFQDREIEIFEDWQNDGENFPDDEEDCDQISEPLPPVDFFITPDQKSLTEPLCAAPVFKVTLINHRKVEQPFAFYVRVNRPDDLDGTPVFHRVISGRLDGFETRDYFAELSLGCNGVYIAGFFLFERMWSLQVWPNDKVANPLIPPRPGPDEYLPLDVASPQWRSFTIDSSSLGCQFKCTSCDPEQTDSRVVPEDQSCPAKVVLDCGLDCPDLIIPVSRDADQDGIPDIDDNCPTVIGDVCEERELTDPINPDQIAPLLDELSKLEIARILESLFLEPDSPVGGPWCMVGLTCPEVFDVLWSSMLDFTIAFDEGLVTPEAYTSIMQDILRGPTVRTDTTQVTSISLDSERNALILMVEAPTDDLMTIRLPRALVDSRLDDQIANLEVLVNGKERNSFEVFSASYRVLEMPLETGDSEIWISGTQLGPHVGDQGSIWSIRTILALGCGAALIGLIIIGWMIRIRQKRSKLATTLTEQRTENTS